MVWCVRRRDLSRDLKEVREGVRWKQGRGKRRCQVPVECSGTVCPLQSRLLSLLCSYHTLNILTTMVQSLFVSASAQENDLWVQSRCPNSSVSGVVCGARPGVNDGAEWTGEADWESFTSSANPVPLPCG